MEYQRNPETPYELNAYYRVLDRIEQVSWRDSMEAFERLMRDVPFAVTVSKPELLDKGLLPSADLYIAEPLTAKDWLTIAPLAALGPDLDASVLDIARTAGWYETAATYALQTAQGRHGLDCYAETSHGCRCPYSDVCPLRYMERYFDEQAVNQDFDSILYREDPTRVTLLAGAKLMVGRLTGVLTELGYERGLRALATRIDAHDGETP